MESDEFILQFEDGPKELDDGTEFQLDNWINYQEDGQVVFSENSRYNTKNAINQEYEQENTFILDENSLLEPQNDSGIVSSVPELTKDDKFQLVNTYCTKSGNHIIVIKEKPNQTNLEQILDTKLPQSTTLDEISFENYLKSEITTHHYNKIDIESYKSKL
ncbi:hypothetical protein A3Q56_01505 [Intoshia linei]|uniref:Uncharacterized protein n=1 Tax=Intoshia linei TaxID=1819745 RepID=A0A177B927_9BILA|nr:hypothetical protein A3Q56_01505 [Intoshia linei]